MPRAIFNHRVIAESEDTVKVEGNHYFPLESLDASVISESATTTVCPWKGTASYYSVTVDGQTASDAVWYYPQPKDAAAEITGRVAFWKGVTVQP